MRAGLGELARGEDKDLENFKFLIVKMRDVEEGFEALVSGDRGDGGSKSFDSCGQGCRWDI